MQQPSPDLICLHVDAERLQLSCGQRTQQLRGRWAVAFLHTLIVHGHTDARSAARVETMQRSLQRCGLSHSLRAVEWSRIVNSLKQALDALVPDGRLSARLQHWPRGKTVGPWWFQVEGAAVTCSGLAAVPHQPVLPPASDFQQATPLSMAESPHGARALELTRKLKSAMEAHWKALPAFAVELLADDAAWAGESAALRALRRLRLAELMQAQGEHEAALALLARMDAEIAQPELAALIAPHAAVTRWRVAYAGDPVGRHAAIGKELRNALAARQRIGASWLDATAMAEHFHLLMLCERRGLEQSPATSLADEPAAHRLATMLHSGHSALLLFFLVRNYDRAQHVCANLAYAHQQLARARPGEHLALALGWHTLSFAMHTSFGGAESSAWEYIYLGELWLDSEDARQAWATQSHDAAWYDESPDCMGFYETACRIADQVGDPRQQAYTRLNRYRYARDHGVRVQQRSATASLAAVLADKPHLVTLLRSEGYALPGDLRRRQSASV